jgi:hypothetical protein
MKRIGPPLGSGPGAEWRVVGRLPLIPSAEGRATPPSPSASAPRSTAPISCRMLIEHVVTADLDDGSPVVPGFVDDGIYWACVVRLPNARTRWRRISLAETRAAGSPPRHTGISPVGRQSKAKER